MKKTLLIIIVFILITACTACSKDTTEVNLEDAAEETANEPLEKTKLQGYTCEPLRSEKHSNINLEHFENIKFNIENIEYFCTANRKKDFILNKIQPLNTPNNEFLQKLVENHLISNPETEIDVSNGQLFFSGQGRIITSWYDNNFVYVFSDEGKRGFGKEFETTRDEIIQNYPSSLSENKTYFLN